MQFWTISKSIIFYNSYTLLVIVNSAQRMSHFLDKLSNLPSEYNLFNRCTLINLIVKTNVLNGYKNHYLINLSYPNTVELSLVIFNTFLLIIIIKFMMITINHSHLLPKVISVFSKFIIYLNSLQQMQLNYYILDSKINHLL